MQIKKFQTYKEIHKTNHFFFFFKEKALQEYSKLIHVDVWQKPTQLKTFTSFDPIIALLGIYYKEIRDAYQSMIYNNENLKS